MNVLRYWGIPLSLIYKCQPIGIMVRMFANGPGDWDLILHQVIPKTQRNGT